MNLNQPTWNKWLRGVVKDEQARQRAGLAELGPHCLGMITGQDSRALAAVAGCWQLYASSDERGAESALCAVVVLLAGMQQKCWIFARALIAYAMDWSDIERVWREVTERREEIAMAETLGELERAAGSERVQ